jgi:hypothetical protein
MNDNEANTKGRERLQELTSQLSDKQLALPAGEGWTVSGILSHLAFWDYRALGLVQRWKLSGVEPSPMDTDNVNDAMKPLLLAIPGKQAASLAIQAAEAIDAELENLPGELRTSIEALVQQGKFRLNRSIHRNQHLDQIEKSLNQTKV